MKFREDRVKLTKEITKRLNKNHKDHVITHHILNLLELLFNIAFTVFRKSHPSGI